MLFKGKNEYFVEFRILEYQFPNESIFESDANWLRFLLKVNTRHSQYEKEDPGLTTFEVTKFYDFFNTIYENNAPFLPKLELFDNYLVFEFVETNSIKNKRIRIHLSHEEVFEANVSKEELKDFIVELADAKLKFPIIKFDK